VVGIGGTATGRQIDGERIHPHQKERFAKKKKKNQRRVKGRQKNALSLLENQN